MGSGEIVATTVDGAGRPVLVGTVAHKKAKPESATVRCGALWVGDGTASTGKWKRGGLGCGEDWPITAITLTDGRVLVAGNRDLWTSAVPGAKAASG